MYPSFLGTWDAYAFPIQRADAFRYFVLHHYGGIYLDMDTWCNQTIPIHEIEPHAGAHYALFKSTVPTGVTNDFMMTTAHHPIYASAIAKLPIIHATTRTWARWQPYCTIMISAGPMFLTLILEQFMLAQASLPLPTVGVINATQLAPYITDLESGTWHRSDARMLMWIGQRPWTWFIMGAMGLAASLFIFNRILTMILDRLIVNSEVVSYDPKWAKAS